MHAPGIHTHHRVKCLLTLHARTNAWLREYGILAVEEQGRENGKEFGQTTVGKEMKIEQTKHAVCVDKHLF